MGTCNGEKNQGATNLQTLYDNLETCKTIINNTCNANMPAVNMTFMDACKATMDGFVNETDKAIKATGAAACVIWESEKLANISAMLKDCSLKEHESAHTSAKKACTGNFSFCRQEEDKVSKLVSACSASNSVAKVTAAIAQGTKNQAAATAVSAKVNATLEANRRLRREDTTAAAATTATTCADFATKVTEVSIHVTGSPLLATLETILTELANATVATCTDADKSSLGNASTTFLSSTESITLAIAEKQSALNISTGSTVSVADITTVAATTVTTTTGTTGTTTTGTTGTTTTGTTTSTTTGTTTTGTTTSTTTVTTTTGTTTSTTSTTTSTTSTTTST